MSLNKFMWCFGLPIIIMLTSILLRLVYISNGINEIKNTVVQQTHECNYFSNLQAVDTVWNPDCLTECYVHFVKKK